MADLLVLFHSVSGGTFGLARAIAEGIEEVDGCSASLGRVPEIEDGDSIFGGHAQERPQEMLDIPVISPADLEAYDGYAIGCPIYFGRMSSAMSYFWDHTGKQWGELAGRPATAFTSGGSGAGNETAILSLWATFATHGLTIVPLGTRAQSVTPSGEVSGAGAFGAASIGAGPGDRPSDAERAAARIQGRALAEITSKLTR